MSWVTSAIKVDVSLFAAAAAMLSSLTEFTMSTSALCMDNTLRNTLSVKVSEFINQMEVLKQDGTPRTSSDAGLIIVDRITVRSSQDGHFFNVRCCRIKKKDSTA